MMYPSYTINTSVFFVVTASTEFSIGKYCFRLGLLNKLRRLFAKAAAIYFYLVIVITIDLT